MKILVLATFSYPDHIGGAERVIHDVTTRLAARGHSVELLTSNPGTAPTNEHIDGVTLHRYPVDRSTPTRFYRSVFKGVRTALAAGIGADADVWALHQLLSALAALARGARRKPTVLTFHAPYHLEFLARWRDGRADGRVPTVPRALSALLRHGDRWVLRRSDEILAFSDFAASQVGELDRRAFERITLAPPGVDLGRFRPAHDEFERARCAAAFNLPEDVPLLLSVRRLVPRMGLSDLVDATARLATDGTPACLAIAGDGPERATLEQRIRDRGLGDQVRMLGRVTDERLPQLYRAASVFALPTRSLEGFGMATAEALASGLPVVATRVGASIQVLAPLQHATLVEPAAPDALAAGLAPLLANHALRARAGAEARRHAETQLDWSRHIDAFTQAAERAIAAGPQPRGNRTRS